MANLNGSDRLVRLEIPAAPAYVGVARSVITAVAASFDEIDDDRLEDLRVAVSEACTNAVEAHRRAAIADPVVLSCGRRRDAVEIRIEDKGPGFDPSVVPAPPALDVVPSESAEHGWGVQLIHALVDEATFKQTAEGTTVELVMRFAAADG